MVKQTDKIAKNLLEQKLIEAVKLRPAIFQSSHIDHKHSGIVENCWRWVYDQIGGAEHFDSPSKCTEMWKNIWSQYLGHKRKLKTKSGQAAAKKPFFRHELSMQSFDDRRNEEENLSNIEESAEVFDESEVNQIIEQEGVQQSSDNNATGCSSTTTATTGSRVGKGRSHQGSNGASKVPNKSFDKQLIHVLKPQPMDEMQFFSSTVAMKLKNIFDVNSKAGLETQKKINDIIFEAEYNLLQ